MSLDISTADFALRTYREAAAVNQSLFISPFSILIALGMTYVGSSGNTKSQMKATLFGSSFEDDHINSFMSNETKSLNYSAASNGYELYLANRLFGHRELHVLPEFKKCIKEQYSGDLELLDFGQGEKACKHINGWIENKTKGKIKDLIPKESINELTRLVLVNAIYFKADWKTPFNAALTKKGTFFLNKGEEKQIEMMGMEKQFQYAEEGEYQILGIPYATDKLLMYFILPKEKFGLKEMMAKLNAKKLLNLIDSMVERQVEVHIPKFKLQYELELKNVLNRLGLSDMFDPKLADFSKITGSRDLYVSEAFHKAFIEVRESRRKEETLVRWPRYRSCSRIINCFTSLIRLLEPEIKKRNRKAISRLAGATLHQHGPNSGAINNCLIVIGNDLDAEVFEVADTVYSAQTIA